MEILEVNSVLDPTSYIPPFIFLFADRLITMHALPPPHLDHSTQLHLNHLDQWTMSLICIFSPHPVLHPILILSLRTYSLFFYFGLHGISLLEKGCPFIYKYKLDWYLGIASRTLSYNYVL